MAFSKMSRSSEGKQIRNGPIRAEMRRQLHILDGDSTDHETLQSIIKRNRELIRQLRQENKELHKQKAQTEAADEQIIKAAFKRIGKEKERYRNISLKEAVSRAEQMVFDKQKRLNAMKFKTQTYQQQLDELKMKEQVETAAPAADDRRREDVATSVRSLENNLEKMQLKCEKAKEIRRHYEEIKAQLQSECLGFPGRLDRLEAELLKAKEELHRMEDVKKKTQLAKDTAEAELKQLEERLSGGREERERRICDLKQQIAECDACLKRAQKVTVHAEELSEEMQGGSDRVTNEQVKAMFAAEEAYQRMEELTSTTSKQELKNYQDAEKQKQLHLEKMVKENRERLQEAKQQRNLLKLQLETIQSERETNRSSLQQLMEDRKQQLQVAKQKCDASKKRRDDLVQILDGVTEAVRHIADKLQDVTLRSEDDAVAACRDSKEQVVELLSRVEQKLHVLQEKQQGMDLNAVRKEMMEPEWLEKYLAASNTRVRMHEDDAADEDDSDEE